MFVSDIALQLQSTYPLLYKKYGDDLVTSCAEMFDLAMESQSEVNFMSEAVQNTPWKVFSKQISKSKRKSQKSSVPSGSPDDGGDGDDNDDKDKKSVPKKSGNPKKIKKKKMKRFQFLANDSSSDESDNEYKDY